MSDDVDQIWGAFDRLEEQLTEDVGNLTKTVDKLVEDSSQTMVGQTELAKLVAGLSNDLANIEKQLLVKIGDLTTEVANMRGASLRPTAKPSDFMTVAGDDVTKKPPVSIQDLADIVDKFQSGAATVSPSRIFVNAQSVETLIRCVHNKQKIESIKEIRALTGLGLKEAKDLYERVIP